MQDSKMLSLLSHPRQREVLDQWSLESGKLIEHHDDVLECSSTVQQLHNAIVFIGWHADAPGESAKNLALIKADTHSDIYIVVIADKSTDGNDVHAFQLGADRFFSCDTSLSIFAALIESIEKKIAPTNHVHHYPPYRLDNKTRAVYFGRNRIVLTPREFRIAHYLFENKNRPLTRESLLKDVWGLPDLKHNRRVDTKMSHIRRKMQLDGAYGWKLKFPRGEGYHLQCNIGNGSAGS
ncbi:MAG: response regulator transcription factor [Granulosicoccus sp.]|nr:response regulator transcription factor [Granulosicoccus sp.]